MVSQKKRIAVYLNTPLTDQHVQNIRSGKAPRHDILMLAERLNATLIVAKDAKAYPFGGRLGRAWRLFSMGWQAFRQRKNYDLIVTDLDAIGLILAGLLKVSRSKKQHIVICHGKIVRGGLNRLTRWLRLDRQVDYFVCYGPLVHHRMLHEMRLPPEKVKLVKHPADHHWWKPTGQEPERLIAAAGMSDRDYVTLAEAVRGLDVQVRVAAFSPWVDPRRAPPSVPPPENVTYTRMPQSELRDLYARSMFVVVPLFPTRGQSGSLVIYESMAMGKGVVVGRTQGEMALGLVEDGVNGLFYEPGDVDGLRSAIKRLLDNPEEAKRLGEGARAIVERELNMDRYFDEIVALVESLTGEMYPALPVPSSSRAAG